MPSERLRRIAGRAVPLLGDDIDTDQIIPARFLKSLTFDGLGAQLFHDLRYHADGAEKPHPLNEARYAGATILLAGANFGCGSSREHAPQALRKHGIRAVVAEGFAEIFHGNSTALGLPCVCASPADLSRLAAAVHAEPTTEVVIDLGAGQILFDDQAVSLHMPDSARNALVNGRWDALAELLEGAAAARAVASKFPYASDAHKHGLLPSQGVKA